MKSAKDLSDFINTNYIQLLSSLESRMVDTYKYINKMLWKTDVSIDDIYRRKFRGYYIMRYVSSGYADAFFTLFEMQKSEPLSFADLSRELYKVGDGHQLSFISKMLHSLDDEKPIFDNNVGTVFGIKRKAAKIDDKIAEDAQILAYMSSVYESIEQEGLVSEAIEAFDAKFPANGISFTKKVDFLLWRAPEIKPPKDNPMAHSHCLICTAAYLTAADAQNCFSSHGESETLRWLANEVHNAKIWNSETLKRLDYSLWDKIDEITKRFAISDGKY